ncbi:MAG: hypothetical protein AAGI69_28930 [Cyanobacteria bacterium P01_H01_bin.21]
MTALTLEEQKKQDKLKQLIKTLAELSIKKKELKRNKRSKKILINAIKGTFLAAFLWAKIGDLMALEDDELIELGESDSDSILNEALLDEALLDEAFDGLFLAFEGLEASELEAMIGEMDLCDLEISELDAAQDELNILMIKIA